MSFFQNASHSTISGGHFTSVGRDQTIIHLNFPRGRAERPQPANPLFEEYQTIRRGDMHFLRQHYADKQAIVYEEDAGGRVRERLIRATRTANSARVLGPGMGLNYLAVTYAGEQGGETWQDDFERFARTPAHPVIAQLFGFNPNSPALVFHDDLIPVKYFWEQHHHSSLAITYLHYRVKSDWSKILTVMETPKQNGLWLQPASGVICAGPQGTTSPDVTLERVEVHCTDVLLPLKIYGDDGAILQYFERIDIYSLVSESCDRSGIRIWEDILPLPIGSILSVNNRQVVAQIPCHLSAVNGGPGWYGDDDNDDKKVMGNGWTRFSFTQVTGNLHLFCYCSLLPSDHQRLRFSWLSQANFMFDWLRIPVQRDTNDYLLVDCVQFQWSWYSNKRIDFEETVYLFLSPVVQRLPSQAGWYITKPTYYWSLDPSGETRITADELMNPPETPELRIDALQFGHEWHPYHYSAIRQHQVYKGFDPRTQDHARSLRYPLLEIIGDDSRFQEIEETASDSENELEEWHDALDT